MTNAKWLALAAAFGLALALSVAACSDDNEPTTCSSNEDCADTESCDTSCSLCAPLDGRCTADSECTNAGETCQPIGEGCSVKTCSSGGTGGTGGTGTCTGQADCYPDQAYCTEGDVCAPLATTISTCAYGPDAPDAEGPMVIFIQQTDEEGTGLCAKDPTNCPNNGNVCWFKLTAWDPNADWPTSALYSHTKFVRSTDGQLIAPFNTRNGVADGNFFDFEASGCYDESVTSLGGGFVILDNANHQSNTGCVSVAGGTAP